MPRNHQRRNNWPVARVLGCVLAGTMTAAADSGSAALMAAQLPHVSVDDHFDAATAETEAAKTPPTGWWREWAGIRAGINHEHRVSIAGTVSDPSLPWRTAFNGWADRFRRGPVDGLDDFSGTLSYARGPYTSSAAIHRYRMPASDRASAIEWDLVTAIALGTRARYGRMTAKYADYRINNDALTRSATPAQFGNTRTFWLQWEWQWQSPPR